MGVQLYAVFNQEFPGYDVAEIEGKILSRLVEIPLLAPLMDYVSASQEEYLEFVEETPKDIAPAYEEKWFEPAEALPKVEAMLKSIQADSQSLPTPEGFETWTRGDWLEFLVQDLETIRSQLQSAIKHGAKFHMEFCY